MRRLWTVFLDRHARARRAGGQARPPAWLRNLEEALVVSRLPLQAAGFPESGADRRSERAAPAENLPAPEPRATSAAAVHRPAGITSPSGAFDFAP